MKGIKLPKKNRLYFVAILAIVGVLAWAFITASMITRDFNRQQRNAQGESQEAVKSMVIPVNGTVPKVLPNSTVLSVIFTKIMKFL